MVPIWYAVLVLVCYASAASTPSSVRDRGGAGEGRGGDQRQSRARRALRPDPRRAQHRRAGDDEDDRALRRLRRGHGAVRRAPAHPPGRGGRTGGADRRSGDDRCRAARGRRSSFGSGVSLVLGVLAAGANVAGGLPVAGSLAFGASWAGVGSRRHRPHRRGVPALAERAHVRSHRVGGDRRTVRPARGRRHDRRVMAELALAVRLEHPVARLRRHPMVGAAAVHRRWPSGSSWSPARLRSRRDLGAGIVAPRPGPATARRVWPTPSR